MDLDVNKHPFFQKDGKYYFWDETEADSVGPFDTPELAIQGMKDYCAHLEIENEEEMKRINKE